MSAAKYLNGRPGPELLVLNGGEYYYTVAPEALYAVPRGPKTGLLYVPGVFPVSYVVHCGLCPGYGHR